MDSGTKLRIRDCENFARSLLAVCVSLIVLLNEWQWVGAAGVAPLSASTSPDSAGKRVLRPDFGAGEARATGEFQWRTEGSIRWVPGLTGRAPVFEAANSSIVIPYGEGTNEWFSATQGCIRFRFQPNWSSGEGPGQWTSLLSIGIWKPDESIGFWGLGTNPTGDKLNFSSQKINVGRTYLSVPLKLKAGQWHDILLVYSGISSYLYIDGQPIGPGKGVSAAPPDEVVAEYGLRVGNNFNGNQPARGTIDRLEFYPEPVSGFVQRRDRLALSGTATEDPPSVALEWPAPDVAPVSVRRRPLGKSAWTDLGMVTATNRFVDTSSELQSGGRFEYAVGDRRLVQGIGVVPPAEKQGRVLLVVTERVAARLENEVKAFATDLVGDGWSVEQVKVPQHDMGRRSRYQERIAIVKRAILAFYQRSPEESNVVLLLGQVPVPYSGFRAEDGHTQANDDHQGAWPCDAYYADMDGAWTDKTVNYSNRRDRTNTNRPSDGRFDQDFLPSDLEVAVGRIDFSNMSVLSGSSLPGRPSRRSAIELGLLKRYLEKNHAYRHGELRFKNRATYQTYLPDRLWANMDQNAFINGAAMFGSTSGGIGEEDCFESVERVRWGFLAGYGAPASLASGRYRTIYFNDLNFGPKAAFVVLYSSWSADWQLPDSFLKAMLTPKLSGLAVMSSLHGQWDFAPMALGRPLAEAYLATGNQTDKPVGRSMGILGDVTLRLHVVPPVNGLVGRWAGGQITLNWDPANPAAGCEGVYVYRGESISGPFYPISCRKPLKGETYVDPSPRPDRPVYLVRQARTETSPAGRYVNLSQGVFWDRTKAGRRSTF